LKEEREEETFFQKSFLLAKNMMLKFAGIGAAFCPALGNTCGYVKRDKELILMDCGGTAFAALHGAGALQGLERLTCVVTHRHPDHTGSLGTLISYAKHVAHFAVTVVHPDPALGELLRLSGISEKDYRLVTAEEWQEGDVKVRFYPVTHTASIPAWGFTLTLAGETLYYSGDGEKVPDTVWAAFLNGEVAAVYQDCGRTPHKGHGDFETLRTMTPPHLRSRVYPMHLDSDYRDELRAAGFGVAF